MIAVRCVADPRSGAGVSSPQGGGAFDQVAEGIGGYFVEADVAEMTEWAEDGRYS